MPRLLRLVAPFALAVVAGFVPVLPAADDPPAVRGKIAPDVCGEREAVAVQQLRLADLGCETGVFYIAPDKWRAELKEGVVYLQAPQAKAVVLPGDGVAVWRFRKADADQKVVEVPDLTGLTAAEATDKLAAVGLAVTTPADPDAKPPTGKVADQYPPAKQSAYARTAVFLRYR